MIQANELRVGNKLQKDNGEIFTILRLDNTQDVLVEEQRGLLTLNYNLFGIPLTEEWLVKLGIDFLILIVNDITFRFEKINFDWICHIDDSIILEIKHVHNIQNLCYALTGEELPIKN